MLWTKIKVAVTVGFVAAAATGGGVAVNRYAAAEDGAKAVQKEGGTTPSTGAKPVEGAGKAQPAAAPKPPEPKPAADAEMAKFEGVWAFDSATVNDKPDAPGTERYAFLAFTANGGLKLTESPERPGGPLRRFAYGSYHVDPAATPKRLWMNVGDRDMGPGRPSRGTRLLGEEYWLETEVAYLIAGDTLKIARLAPPPKPLTFTFGVQFHSPFSGKKPASRDLFMSVWKHVKPADEPHRAKLAVGMYGLGDDRKADLMRMLDDPAPAAAPPAADKPPAPRDAAQPARSVTPPAADQARILEEEMAKFNGNWVQESLTLDGKQQPVAILVGSMTTFDGRGGVQEVTWLPTPSGRTGKYRVNHRTSPKQVTIVFDDKPGMVSVRHAIYEFDGDKLRMATAGGAGEIANLPRGFTVADQLSGSSPLWVTTYRPLRPGEGVKPAELAKDKPAPAAPVGRLKQLRRERAAVLEKSIALNVDIRNVGAVGAGFHETVSTTELVEERRQLSRTELDLAETDAERVASLEKLIAGVKSDEAYFTDRQKAGMIRPRIPLALAAARIDAEIELEQVRARAAKPAEGPKPAAAAPPGKLKQLQRERVALLKESLAEVERAGLSVQELQAHRRSLYRAELDACDTGAERAEVLRKLVKLAAADEERAVRLNAAGSISSTELRAAKLARIEAEIELQKAIGP